MGSSNGIHKYQHQTIESGVESFMQDINSQYYLKLDEKSFSPVIQISAFLVLKYLGNFTKTEDKKLHPFLFSFPDKKSASVWLSICLLTNFFDEDYYKSEGLSVNELEVGRKYQVYSSIGEFRGIIKDKNEEKFKFKIKDSEIIFKKSIRSIIKNVNQSRQLNKYEHFYRSRKKARQNRTAISKILEPNEGIIINDQVLTSKVLLVAGRGNITSIKNLINTCIIYDEPISKVFAPNNNIILKPDLKDYKVFFEQNKNEQINIFLDWIGRLLEDSKVDDKILELLLEIKSNIEQDEAITSEIDDSFKCIVEEYADTEPRLQKLMDDYYPGISSELPEDLKAVIINDINQIEDYPNTIKGFLDKQIPVIVVTNRMIEKSSDLLFFKRLFDSENGIWKDAYRINWNRSKLNSLINVTSPDSYFMDNPLWKSCQRYARQIIKIDIFQEPDGYNLDEKIWQLVQKIKNLQGFEYLKTSFFQYLNPLLYAFKNSHFIDVDDPVKILIEKFKEEWVKSKNYLSSKSELVDEIETVLKQLESGEFENSKPQYTQNVYSAILSTPDYGQLNIPVGSETNQPEQHTEKIIFSGFPYNEYSGKYLHNACLNYFIPEIDILCWPFEGERTYSYLRRRIESGYFFDKLPEDTGFPEEIILSNQAEIEDEVSDTLVKTNKIEIKGVDFQTEDDLIALDNFQYEKYKCIDNVYDKFRYIVNCNVVRFNDGSFMFLPSQSTVLSEIENESGRISVRGLKFNQLSIGFRIFKFSKDQLNYSEILQSNPKIKIANSVLSIWHSTLSKLTEEFGSIQDLCEYLVSVVDKNKISGANPDVLNIRRWLNDEDLIAPNMDNLRVILIAGKEKNIIHENIDDISNLTIEAFNFIKSAHISLGHKIKSAIAAELKRATNEGTGFAITVNDDIEVSIVAKQIIELQTNDIPVEYQETRKFLC
jgi:hypothetical protein